MGSLQAAADGIKLIFKEDITPAKADPILFTLGPAIVVIPVFLSYLIVPFGQNMVITDIGVGIFFVDCPLQYCPHWSAHVGVFLQQ